VGQGHTHPHAHEHGPEHGPEHAHGNAREHGLAARPEEPLGPSGEASVVLDIGPHAGALVLYTAEDLAGEEIELRPRGGAWRGVHTAVRERHVAGGVRYAGVFGSLAPGPYDLRLKGGGPGSFSARADVVAGTVTEARLPGSAPASCLPVS
jgi:hypothetical protein